MARALPALGCPSTFQPMFDQIVDELVHQLKRSIPVLHSIYIAGSVARLEAVPGQSDLNVTLVTTNPLTASAQAILNSIVSRIESQCPQIVAVNMTLLVKHEVLDIAAIFKWGFWLKHCCVCVCGDDLSSRFGCFEPSWDIGKSMNDDLPIQLNDYRRNIMATRVVSHYLSLCRDVAKKMIWSCYTLVFHRSGKLALSIEQAAQQFLSYYPQHKLAIDRLFMLISGQQVPKKAVLFMINDFGQWIVTEFDKIERKIG
ncbi:nucleotidyltransferase domain-containing protein [Photobacterium sp. DNB23_23_1]|uniref:Nucleotidyltransferase domain-containing protein n=1 Tax=Photobacterium pectinilyticum TaxID=2906793 RepID=A0ABT1N2F0_9GAMM|nr:nucleotidyltransferase domain-containing protein [Photobacterium sp. ZSDE20]MCQ1058712.1 nucleotidyltransferase domain-containing protein [Photobacterium sp. ZSDE20]MDD1823494.1 nucleotidyltransferase domain-containing protein [Photobacterium sp. ZSDE20]